MAHDVSTKQKTKDGKRNCQVCGLAFPDIYAYTDHLESKEHTKGIMKKKYGAKYLAAKAHLFENVAECGVTSVHKNDNKSADNAQKSADADYYYKMTKNPRKEEIEKTKKDSPVNAEEDYHKSMDSELSDDDDAEVYTCEECKKICTGILSYRLHLSGKKHLKTIKKNKILKQMQKEKILPEKEDGKDDTILDFNDDAVTSSGILCKVCNKTCSGPQSFKQHNESEGHRKKVLSQKIAKEMSDRGPDVDEDIDSDEGYEQPVYARCDSCSKSFSGPIPYKQHMQSTAHFKQARHLKQMAKFKDLVVTSEDDNKIQCKECNRYFSGPLPYHDHVKSTVHEKKREKNDMIKSLQEKYKELAVRPNLTPMDSDDSDDGKIFSCTACHTAFTGPESARDHFQSQKHKKAAKEKMRLKKLKLLKNGKKSEVDSSSANGSLNRDDESDKESTDSFDIIG